MTTGQRMKDRRKEIGLSAETVAEMLNVSPATIYRYENGDIEKVPGDRLGAIANVLRTTPAYLMGWESKPTTSLAVKCPQNDLTADETELICKYRCLDDRGKAAVLNTLNHEYDSLPGEKSNSLTQEA